MEEKQESSEERPVRWALPVLMGTGIVLELLYLLAWRPISSQFAPDKPTGEWPVVAFLLLWFVTFAIYFAAIRCISRIERRAVALAIVAMCAVAFRLTMWHTPLIIEDDIYRYLWDGRVTAHGQNPFRFAPREAAEFAIWKGVDLPSGHLSRDQICRMARAEIEELAEDDSLSGEDLLRLSRLQELSRRERVALSEVANLWDADQHGELLLAINHPHIPTIYPPFAQVVFAVASWVKPMSIGAMKGIVILFDLLTVGLIVLLLRTLRLNPCLCIIYAWSPLVIKEFANSGHCDAIAVCCVVLALVLLLMHQGVMAGAGLALGFLVKMFPLVLVPIAWKRMRWRGVIAFAVVAVLFYLPFADLGVAEMFQGFGAYADRWEFNSSLFTLFEKNIAERIIHLPYGKINPFLVTKLVAGVAFLAVLLLLVWKGKDEGEGSDVNFVRRMFIVVGALLLLGPVSNAWYFCWALPFLCVFPKRSWLLLTCLVGLAYVYYVPVGDGALWSSVIKPVVSHIPFGPRGDAALWQALPEPERNVQLHQWWRTFGVRFVEYIPFYVLLVAELAVSWRAAKRSS